MHAWVLHSRPWLRGMQMTELLTDALGRLVVLGHRPARKGGYGQLRPLVPLRVQVRGEGDMRRLLSWEPEGYPQVPQAALPSALEIHSTILRLFERLEGVPLYPAYRDYVARLCDGDGEGDGGVWACRQAALLLRIRLLQIAGYGFSASLDARDAPLHAQRRYRFEPGQGWVPLPQGQDPSEGGAPWALGSEIADPQLAAAEASLGRWERLLGAMLAAAASV